MTGSNQFLRNGEDGLSIRTDGAITLANITAEGNGIYGAYLFNAYSGMTAGVTIKGENSFNGNGWDGLNVITNGAVLLNSITANDNGWDPARGVATQTDDPDTIPLNGDEIYWYDAAGKGAVIINWVSNMPKGVTLTGVNTFNGNASAGLLVDTAGLLNINNLTANDNGCDPAYEGFDYTYYCAGAFLWGAGVNVTGYGNFSGNANKGLNVENNYVYSVGSSVGAITLNNIYAEGNGNRGVYASTYGTLAYNVTLLGVNTFLNNGSSGLAVYSNGVVTLNNLTANDNGSYGVYVDNTDATSAKAVIINGAGTYMGNTNGLGVFSNGAITTNGIMAFNNSMSGVILDNCNEDSGNPGTCLAFAGQAVNMNGINTIANSGATGLYIFSRGAVTISSLTSSNNAFDGVYVDNFFTNALGGITFKNYVNSFANGVNGILAYSKGAVVVASVHANSNGGSGMEIDNSVGPAVPVNVTISGTNSFSGNGVSGLVIDTYGVVTLNNIFANGNGSAGADIDNYQGNATSAKAITITGVNNFNGNAAGSGLSVISLGAIVVNKVTANSNGGEGAYLDNQFNVFSQPITIVGYGTFNGNALSGLVMYSNGAITMANLVANNNGESGASIWNNSLTTTPQNQALSVNVTLTGINQFSNNTFDGLLIDSDGVITLNSITASYNGDNGLDVTNTNTVGGSVGKGLTLNGWNTFIGNDNTGLWFDISGAVVLNRVVSSYNTDGGGPNAASGIDGTSGSTITITCASLNNNEDLGYNLSAVGMITLKGVFTYGNLGNAASGTPVVITRSCTLP